MDQKTKFIIISLVSILVISFFMSSQIYNSKRTVEQEKDILKKENASLLAKINETNQENQRLKDKVDALDRDLQTVAQEKEEAQKKYELVNKEREELTEQIKTVKAEAEKAQILAAETVPQREDARVLLKAIRDENSLLKRQLKTLTNRKFNLDKKLFEVQKENATLTDKIAAMDRLLKEPQAEKKEAVELAPIIVRPKTAENVLPQTPFFTGTVLSVNKENNFVVIDLGLDNSVKAGQVFGVYREDKNIGSIEVVQPRRAISACDIKKETTAIVVGDTVR